jgi:hypothetical protein
VIAIERAGLALAALARHRELTRRPFPPDQQVMVLVIVIRFR